MTPACGEHDCIDAWILVDGRADWRADVAGLSVLTRSIAAAARAGAQHVHVVTPTDRDASESTWPPLIARETGAMSPPPNVSFSTDIPDQVTPPTARIIVTRPIVFDPREVAGLLAVNEGVTAIRRPGDQEIGLWLLAGDSLRSIPVSSAQILAWLESRSPVVHDPGDSLFEEWRPTRADIIHAKLFAQARKVSDSWVARNVDRRLSLALTRHLVHTTLTPNQITLSATAIGLLGVGLLGWGTFTSQLLGAFLLTASIIVDGCDGEVARIKFLESEFGRKLDFFLDNVVNVTALFAVGAGYAWRSGDSLHLYAATANATAAAAAVWPVYSLYFRTAREGVRVGAQTPRRSQVPADRLDQLIEGIAGRDFAYAILALAVFGKAHWFTPICFVGLVAFLVAVGVLVLRRRLARPPHSP